jgi:excisionase family DNA binding protein
MNKSNGDQAFDPTGSNYATTAEVAKHFRVAVATVANMVHSGEIPSEAYIRIGRIYRFDLQKIEDHLRKLTKAPENNEQLELDFNENNGD